MVRLLLLLRSKHTGMGMCDRHSLEGWGEIHLFLAKGLVRQAICIEKSPTLPVTTMIQLFTSPMDDI